MLGYESERRLKNLLISVGDGERDLELARQKLCCIADFALHSAFQRIDRDQNGFITSHEIIDFLRDNSCYHVSESESFALVQFFDCNYNSMLSFQEFIQILLPCEDNILRNVVLDRPARRVGKYDLLPRDIELSTVNVIEKEIDLGRRLEILKNQLHIQYDYSPLSSFRSIDKFNKGYIDTVNLGAFLRQLGHFSSELELLAIIRRIDTNGNATITFEEFGEFLKPTVPVIKQIVTDPIPPARNLAGYGGARNTSPIRNKHERNFSPLRELSPKRRVISPPTRQIIETVHHPVRETRFSTQFVEPVPHIVRHQRISPQRKPILNIFQEDDLVHALKEYCNLESEIEFGKIQLAQKQDFNIFDAFNIIDVKRLGSISVSDLQLGLNEIGIFPTVDECSLFITRYDTNKKGRINFDEFSKAFLAFDPYFASMVNRRVSNYVPRTLRRDDVFLPPTAHQFQQMWRTHIRAENAAEHLRQRLNSNPGFNFYEAFNSLDINGEGYISPEKLLIILESRGYFVNFKEALQVISKFDKNRNGRVTFQEFQEESRNKSPVRR